LECLYYRDCGGTYQNNYSFLFDILSNNSIYPIYLNHDYGYDHDCDHDPHENGLSMAYHDHDDYDRDDYGHDYDGLHDSNELHNYNIVLSPIVIK
jgi:hypothetical protein